MPNRRAERVASVVKQIIGAMLVGEECSDPRIDSLVIVHRVEMSDDLGYGKVFVSGFVGEDRLDSSVQALNHAAGYIQAAVCRKLRLRQTPRLTFIKDLSIKIGFEVGRELERLTAGSWESRSSTAAGPSGEQPVEPAAVGVDADSLPGR